MPAKGGLLAKETPRRRGSKYGGDGLDDDGVGMRSQWEGVVTKKDQRTRGRLVAETGRGGGSWCEDA